MRGILTVPGLVNTEVSGTGTLHPHKAGCPETFRFDAEAKLTPYLLTDIVAGQVGGRLGLFAGAVALVLLVAIANVATLVLVRASAREQELSVRAALGATRRRVAGRWRWVGSVGRRSRRVRYRTARQEGRKRLEDLRAEEPQSG